MKIKYLESKLLYLSNITDENKNQLLDYLNHPLMFHRRYLPWKFDQLLLTEDDIHALINEWNNKKKSRTFGIYDKSSNNLIGHISYNFGWDAHSIELEMVIHPEYWRQGYGKESLNLTVNYIFENTVAHNINTYVDDWNESGCKFAKSNGFKLSGKMRRTGYKDGKYYDSNIYDILKNEWRSE